MSNTKGSEKAVVPHPDSRPLLLPSNSEHSPVEEPDSDMPAPAVKVCLLLFLFLSCFTMLCNALPASFQEEIRRVFDDSAREEAAQVSTAAAKQTGRWVDTWTAAPQAFSPPGQAGDVVFQDATLRQTVPLTIGADTFRLRFSNAFGTTQLPISKVTVALPRAERGLFLGSSSIDAATLRSVTFGGDDSVIVPVGALAVSDPVSFNTSSIKAGQVLSISLHLADGQAGGTVTSHIYSRTSGWMARGDVTGVENLASSGLGPHWHFLSAVEAWTTSKAKAMVVIGDSITDGRNSAMNENVKWPSLLFNRTQSISGLENISVINQGLGGNQLLNNGIGPNADERLDRDVLSHSGVGYLMIYEGINDIGHAPPTPSGQAEVQTRLIQMYKQIISRVHTFNHPVFGATLTPFLCPPKPGRNKYALAPIREQTRLNVNDWIRNSGSFDAVVDFDKALANPRNMSELAPQFNSLDCLHPNQNGLKALAEAFPVDVLGMFGDGVYG